MSRTCTVHILHTNDIHSQYERMPQIATCFKQKRAEYEAPGDGVLILDIGDHVDRSRRKTEATWGHANVEIMNQTGYEYVTIGNNEGLTLPKERLDALYDDATFTVVIGNMWHLADGSTPKWATPFAVHHFASSGLRVALLAVTAPFTSFYEKLGWNVLKPFPILQAQIDALQAEVDAVIVMSHLGYAHDLEMAKQIEGVDVIIGAHTHHLLEQGERVEGKLIAQAGKWGDYVGHITLTFDSESKELTQTAAEVFATESFLPDMEIGAMVERAAIEAEHILAEPIASLADELEIDWERETPFGSFLAASLRRFAQAEIGLANSGLLLAPLHQGQVTRKDLLLCVPHPIKPCVLTLSGAQLLGILERAARQEMVQRRLRGFGFRGEVLGWMGIDGITVRYRPEDAVILAAEVDGKPLLLEQAYRVATIDMFLFNPIFPEFAEARDVHYFLPEVLREVLRETLQDRVLIRQSFLPRWQS